MEGWARRKGGAHEKKCKSVKGGERSGRKLCVNKEITWGAIKSIIIIERM